MSKALLIIDMQKGSFTPESHRFRAMEVVQRINKLAEQFRKEGKAIIYIQHDGSKQEEFIPGTWEWELLDDLFVAPDTIFISKSANDAFYRTELLQKLREHGIEDVWITGCATDFCIDTTIKSALHHDLNVHIPADGHTTADRSGLSAQEIINYYNWVWQNMIPTNGSIKVFR